MLFYIHIQYDTDNTVGVFWLTVYNTHNTWNNLTLPTTSYKYDNAAYMSIQHATTNYTKTHDYIM